MPALVENQRFERYRIMRHLGNGVSGESYEAEDTMLQRKVTLKLIQPWTVLADASRRQFFREMQGISLLSHPYLAAILDYGEIDGRLYVVRRYVTSGSLLSSDGRLWFQAPFSVSNAISYGHQLAQALEHIHQRECLHGALTLSNILVLRGANSDNEPDFAPLLLADVGLANFVRRFGQPPVKLLPITAAPEQLGKRVTSASDQFALAVIIYFWLAGRPPYRGSQEEIEHLKLTGTITPLSSLNTNITSEQETILHQALAVYPDERYPSIMAFADALFATLIHPSYEASLADLASQPMPAPEFERIPETDPASIVELETLPVAQKLEDEQPQPVLDALTHIEPSLEADSEQQPTPIPEPLPQTAPEPSIQPEAVPLPQPEPEPLPLPAPDVYQPLPQPAAEPTSIPPTDTPSAASVEAQEPLEIQTAQPLTSPRFVISLSAGEPYEFKLEREETSLGRAGSDDVLLDQDTSISRHHALLKRENDHYVIYDQRSANGVFVNGQKLAVDRGHFLADGDLIVIGSYELTFRCSMPEAPHKAGAVPPDTAAADAKVGISSKN